MRKRRSEAESGLWRRRGGFGFRFQSHLQFQFGRRLSKFGFVIESQNGKLGFSNVSFSLRFLISQRGGAILKCSGIQHFCVFNFSVFARFQFQISRFQICLRVFVCAFSIFKIAFANFKIVFKFNFAFSFSRVQISRFCVFAASRLQFARSFSNSILLCVFNFKFRVQISRFVAFRAFGLCAFGVRVCSHSKLGFQSASKVYKNADG